MNILKGISLSWHDYQCQTLPCLQCQAIRNCLCSAVLDVLSWLSISKKHNKQSDGVGDSGSNRAWITWWYWNCSLLFTTRSIPRILTSYFSISSTFYNRMEQFAVFKKLGGGILLEGHKVKNINFMWITGFLWVQLFLAVMLAEAEMGEWNQNVVLMWLFLNGLFQFLMLWHM